jgi:CMP-2-keto-3-deoxyoctulosonic acid synthetase
MDGQIASGRFRASYPSDRSDHHARHMHHGEDRVSIHRSDSTETARQAMVQQIRVTLTQRFELRLATVSVAAASAEEQTSSALSQVVSAALNSVSDTSASDAVAQVSNATDGALQQTAEALPSSGAAVAPIDAAATQIRAQLDTLYTTFLANANISSNTAPSGANVVTSGATLISKAKGELLIHTLEGDTVTLRFASKSGVSLYDFQASDGTTQLSGAEFKAFSRDRVTINVQGDLNANEVQAIQDLIDQVKQLADGFFAGDIGAALSAPSLSLDSTQLADYSLHLALRQTFEAYGLLLSAPPASDVQGTDSTNGNGDPAVITTDLSGIDATTPAVETSTTAPENTTTQDALAA